MLRGYFSPVRQSAPRSSQFPLFRETNYVRGQISNIACIASRLSCPLLAQKMSALTRLIVRLICDWAPQLHPGPACFANLWSLSFSTLPFLSFPLSSFSFLPPFQLNFPHLPGCRQQWPRIRWEECLNSVKACCLPAKPNKNIPNIFPVAVVFRFIFNGEELDCNKTPRFFSSFS